jgi:hypothetical protein
VIRLQRISYSELTFATFRDIRDALLPIWFLFHFELLISTLVLSPFKFGSDVFTVARLEFKKVVRTPAESATKHSVNAMYAVLTLA